jgi:hypothetical protein
MSIFLSTPCNRAMHACVCINGCDCWQFDSAMSTAIATLKTRMQVTAQDTGVGLSGGPHFSLHQVGLKPSADQNRRLQPQALLTTADERPPAAARTQLKDLGIPFKQYSKPAGAKTGVVGTLGSGEPRFLLRSDIDALPITVKKMPHSDSLHDFFCNLDTAETFPQKQGIRSLQKVLPLHIVAPGVGGRASAFAVDQWS